MRAAAAVLDSLDDTADPCGDFYGYVCNGWIEKNPIPKGGKQRKTPYISTFFLYAFMYWNFKWINA